MAKPIRCLLFEDSGPDGEQIIKALFDSLPSEYSLSITWLTRRLKLDGQPPIFWTTSIPLVINEQDRAVEVTSRRGKRRSLTGTFWQEDFAFAILDVFDLESNTTFGEVLAEWLNYARHTGPIVIMSLHSVAPAKFLLLPKLRVMAKKDEEESWTTLVAKYVMHEMESPEYELKTVGSRGRDPQGRTILRSYLNFLDDDTQSEPSRWRMLFVGYDESLENAVREFFGWKVLKTREDYELTAAKWDSVVIGMQNQRKGKPDVVVLDFGETATVSNELKGQIERIDREFVGKPPQLVLFTDRVSDYDRATELFLLKYGVVIIPRGQFVDYPTQWAEDSVEDLIQRFEVVQFARKASKGGAEDGRRVPETCAQRLLDAHLRVLLMARSTWSITGDQVRPSIVPWLTSYPLSGVGLKGTYSTRLRKVVDQLFKRKLISNSLMRRLRNERENRQRRETLIRLAGVNK